MSYFGSYGWGHYRFEKEEKPRIKNPLNEFLETSSEETREFISYIFAHGNFEDLTCSRLVYLTMRAYLNFIPPDNPFYEQIKTTLNKYIDPVVNKNPIDGNLLNIIGLDYFRLQKENESVYALGKAPQSVINYKNITKESIIICFYHAWMESAEGKHPNFKKEEFKKAFNEYFNADWEQFIKYLRIEEKNTTGKNHIDNLNKIVPIVNEIVNKNVIIKKAWEDFFKDNNFSSDLFKIFGYIKTRTKKFDDNNILILSFLLMPWYKECEIEIKDGDHGLDNGNERIKQLIDQLLAFVIDRNEIDLTSYKPNGQQKQIYGEYRNRIDLYQNYFVSITELLGLIPLLGNKYKSENNITIDRIVEIVNSFGKDNSVTVESIRSLRVEESKIEKTKTITRSVKNNGYEISLEQRLRDYQVQPIDISDPTCDTVNILTYGAGLLEFNNEIADRIKQIFEIIPLVEMKLALNRITEKQNKSSFFNFSKKEKDITLEESSNIRQLGKSMLNGVKQLEAFDHVIINEYRRKLDMIAKEVALKQEEVNRRITEALQMPKGHEQELTLKKFEGLKARLQSKREVIDLTIMVIDQYLEHIDNTLSFVSTFNKISTSNDLTFDIRKLYDLVTPSNFSIDRINGSNKLTTDDEENKNIGRKK